MIMVKFIFIHILLLSYIFLHIAPLKQSCMTVKRVCEVEVVEIKCLQP